MNGPFITPADAYLLTWDDEHAVHAEAAERTVCMMDRSASMAWSRTRHAATDSWDVPFPRQWTDERLSDDMMLMNTFGLPDGSHVEHTAHRDEHREWIVEISIRSKEHRDRDFRLDTGIREGFPAILPDQSSPEAARASTTLFLRCVALHVRTHLARNADRPTGKDATGDIAIMHEAAIGAAFGDPEQITPWTYVHHATPWQAMRALDGYGGVDLLAAKNAQPDMPDMPTRLRVMLNVGVGVRSILIQGVGRRTHSPDPIERMRILSSCLDRDPQPRTT